MDHNDTLTAWEHQRGKSFIRGGVHNSPLWMYALRFVEGEGEGGGKGEGGGSRCTLSVRSVGDDVEKNHLRECYLTPCPGSGSPEPASSGYRTLDMP